MIPIPTITTAPQGIRGPRGGADTVRFLNDLELGAEANVDPVGSMLCFVEEQKLFDCHLVEHLFESFEHGALLAALGPARVNL